MDGAEGRSALKKAEDDEEETADDDHSHKKSRLHWDEANLEENWKEVQRNPKMKIDEPKTPYHRPQSDSESWTAGSSRGDSEPPSPSQMVWMDEKQLEGFESLEKQMNEQQGSSSGSTPRSRSHEEFLQMRRKFYHREFRSSAELGEIDGREEAEENGAPNEEDSSAPPLESTDAIVETHDAE
mmetsp:Transcript_27200/g.105907  ORF Transcript_27200/g.105907 Transcript_27200/m.105907 type:complete len:183 (-) Transcript_27200:1660-2208(-)